MGLLIGASRKTGGIGCASNPHRAGRAKLRRADSPRGLEEGWSTSCERRHNLAINMTLQSAL